jgi:predicted TIM-barrel fold metal-dependent hydrolase
MPLLMGFVAFTLGGLLDRFPNLRVAFLELGCEWVPFLARRIDHQLKFFERQLTELLGGKRKPIDYLRGGQVYVGCEVDDPLLPHVISLMGEEHLLYGSDIPHGDRDSFTVRALQKRDDIPDSAKKKILDDNARRFYRL